MHGRYTIHEILGRGANAITYAATDNTTGKKVRALNDCMHQSAGHAAEQELCRTEARRLADVTGLLQEYMLLLQECTSHHMAEMLKFEAVFQEVLPSDI